MLPLSAQPLIVTTIFGRAPSRLFHRSSWNFPHTVTQAALYQLLKKFLSNLSLAWWASGFWKLYPLMYDVYCMCLHMPCDNMWLLDVHPLEVGNREEGLHFVGVWEEEEASRSLVAVVPWLGLQLSGWETCAGTGLAGRSGVPLFICRRPALLGLVGSRGALIPELEKADVRENLRKKQSVFLPSVPWNQSCRGPPKFPRVNLHRHVVCCLHPVVLPFRDETLSLLCPFRGDKARVS